MSDVMKTVAAVATAIGALKLKRHNIVSTREGVEIHQMGKPVLLLTHQAALDFARECQESE
ncbi:MAG: hypothetical protein Q8N10_03515 [Phenylobacterium sp.]|uniref:hypothetical protein n=1 Tax=Phenylobacterium sp. TaxID=1871053 RepID=UPI002715929D|nr:hypothetical protein [Phenylobacterium sp.]MDO8912339.1 hypothetical protein [Phenylobacterium sp.]MDP3099551.1 hypothetical protein [Phenylobacterium sp.]